MPIATSDVSVIILCGGVGSRLGELVVKTPKPLLEIQGRPFLDYLIRFYEKQGIEHFILCTGYLGEQFKVRYTSSAFSFSHEMSALGTGGAIAQAFPLLKTPYYLAINGDSFCSFDMSELLDFHENNDATLSMVLHKQDDCSRYGKVMINEHNEVTSFIEKQENAGSGLINAGIYLSDLRFETYPSMERDILPHLIGKGLYGFSATEGPFIDIGTPQSFADSSFFDFG